MPALRDRNRKRAASPAVADSQKDEPKKIRKARATKAEPTSDDDNNIATAPKKPPRGSKGKAKAVKAEPESDDEEANINAGARADGHAKKGKGKAKATTEPDDSNDLDSSAQFAKANNLFIPVDEQCNLSNFHVYVDVDDGIIYDAALNQTNAGDNANKFYKIQLLTNASGKYHTWTRWGRVGENGQNALLGDGSLADALKQFDKKFKDKSGLSWEDRGKAAKPKKYVFVERSYEPESDDEQDRPQRSAQKDGSRSRSASPAKCTLEAPVKSLMQLIFNQQYIDYTMADMNYDAAKLPLGKLSKNTITRGYQALKDLSALFDDPSLAQSEHQTTYQNAMENASNLYYSFIPHAFGRNRPPVISDHERLKKEVQLLESLTDLKDADSILKADKSSGDLHPLNARFEGLGMREMNPVANESDEFNHIHDYLVKTCGSTHGFTYELLDVFRIERNGETERFRQLAKTNSDRRLLWHGSRSTNYGGILSQGLRIAPPEAPVSGYMFGKGVYLADMSSKSANYCHAYLTGNHALLLLCEAELGSPMQELTDASYTAGEDALSKGLFSTWGKGQTGPRGWKDASCIHPSLAGVKMPDVATSPGATDVSGGHLLYNEFICYDVAQIRLRYLLRVKM